MQPQTAGNGCCRWCRGLSGSPLLPCAMRCCGAGGLLQSQRSVGIFKKDASPSAILLTPTAVLYVRTSPAGGLSAGAIAGIAVGCTAAVAALAAGAWLLRRRQLRRRKTELQQHKQQTEAGVAGTPPVSGSPKLQRMSDDIPLTALSPFEAVSASALPFGPGPYSCLPSGTASSAGSGSRLPPLPPRPAPLRSSSATPLKPQLSPAGVLAHAGSAPLQAGSSRACWPPWHPSSGGNVDGTSPAAAAAAMAAQGSAGLSVPHTPVRYSLDESYLLQQQARQRRLSLGSRTGSLGSGPPGSLGSGPPGSLLTRGSTFASSSSMPASQSAQGQGSPSGAVLQELMQRAAMQDAIISSSGLATQPPDANASGGGEVQLHRMLSADTLPQRLREWVVDSSALTILRWPNGKQQELGSGARWAGGWMGCISCAGCTWQCWFCNQTHVPTSIHCLTRLSHILPACLPAVAACSKHCSRGRLWLPRKWRLAAALPCRKLSSR